MHLEQTLENEEPLTGDEVLIIKVRFCILSSFNKVSLGFLL
jgi:hypothetical protein